MIVEELERWLQGPGKDERFTGSLKSVFPTHNYDERQHFKIQWASLSLLRHCRMMGRPNEGKHVAQAYYSDSEPYPNNPELQWSYSYQPIDAIRDYFGDAVALYFSWLGIYVQSLVWSSIMGVLVVLWGVVTLNFSPDKNALTLAYTVR